MAKRIDLNSILDELGPGIAERAADRDADDRFVSESYAALKTRRVFSALVPEAYGGGGARHSEMCEFLRALAQRCPSTALALSMHTHLVAAAVANDRAGRPGRKLLDRVVAGEAVLVSTGANDWLESNGTTERVDGGFRVSATKAFASGVPMGDLLVTSAAWEDAPEGAQVIHFPLPLKTEGVSLMDDWRTLGMRATGSQTVRLDRVFVPEEAISLRRPRGTFHPAFCVIVTVAMPLVMSVYYGIAEAAAAIALDRARARAGDPVLPILVGEMESLLTSARLAWEDMVRLANDFDFEPSVALAGKVFVRKALVARDVIATAEKALEVTGGTGFFRKVGLERLLRDVHGAQFHPLPEKRQQLFTGRIALGLDPVSGAPVSELRPAA